MQKRLKSFLFLVGGALIVGGSVAAGVFVANAPPAPTAADIAFGKSAAQRFDVWTPKGDGPFPVVLLVHGGAFMFGDKGGHDGLKEAIAVLHDRGIAVASTNYRLSGEAKFPAAAQDVTAALVELRHQAPALGLDPDRIALWGKSAGGNLALLSGLAAGRPPIGFGAPVPVAAIVAMYAPTRFDLMDKQLRASACDESAANHATADSPESKWLGDAAPSRPDLVAAASPLTYVRASSPPVLLQAGSADCTVPHQQSEIMAVALRNAGVPVRLDIVAGADHADSEFDKPENLAVVAAFLQSAFAPVNGTQSKPGKR